MKRKEINSVLASMSVIVDTREQDTKRSRRRLDALGVPYTRGVLDYGDYAADAVLPDGRHIIEPGCRAHPFCSVERKMDLDELTMCFTTSRERFSAEFKRAQDHGASVWLLVENSSWERLLMHRYRSNMMPKALLGSLTAFSVRYGMHIVFCDETTTPIMIREILYRDLKERLERGDFDA